MILFKMIFVFVLCLLELTVKSHAECSWGYNVGVLPADWVSDFPNCGLTRQSPIDIVTADVKADCRKLKAFEVSVLGETSNQYKLLENTGKTVTLKFLGTNTKGKKVKLNGGGQGNYYLQEANFHWGDASNNTGSEHTIDGRQYPMEIDLLGYTTSANSIMEAESKKNGLVGLAFFVDIGSTNANFAPISDNLQNINETGATHLITETLNLDTLLSGMNDYYRYSGSMTYPGCSENVEWTVFKTPLTISQEQLDQFYNLKVDKNGADTDLINNFRPTQALNKRKVRGRISCSG